MNYREIFESNNVDLQTILNKVNELPDASSGNAGPVLQEKTVSPSTSSQSVTADSGYDGLSKVTVNAIPTATQATPSISINSSGLITASATQSEGYINAGTKSATKQLAVQATKTVTPSESSQTAVAKNVYTTGIVTVGAIPDSYMVGDEISEQANLIAQIASALEGKAAGGGGSEIETCIGTVSIIGTILDDIFIYYVDKNLTLQALNIGLADGNIVFEVVKNSIIYCEYSFDSLSDLYQENVEYLDRFSTAVYVTGDFTVGVSS